MFVVSLLFRVVVVDVVVVGLVASPPTLAQLRTCNSKAESVVDLMIQVVIPAM